MTHSVCIFSYIIDLWQEIGSRYLVCVDAKSDSPSWKKMTCLANRRVEEDAKLLHDVQEFSSADRPSETPTNTLTHSKCWSEIRPYLESPALQNPSELHDVSPFGMTLGERIQHRCGCSTGNSCYWSSSASSNENATEFIDYNLVESCVVSCVQILPYRVFWHPGSPTYAPKKVSFEFYNGSVTEGTQTPFYQSPAYSVVNDMQLQDFVLPQKVVVSGTTVLRVNLLGRHQAQTFELPPWLQRTEEDRLPKYYCCLSYVNVLGNLCDSVEHEPQEMIAPLKEQSIRMANSLAEYMTSCYEGIMDMGRRSQ